MDRVRSMVYERPLVIFSKSSCCLCHAIKTFFIEFGVNATVYELDEIPKGREIEQALSRQLGCKPIVPAVFISGELIGGLSEVNSLHLRQALMPMGLYGFNGFNISSNNNKFPCLSRFNKTCYFYIASGTRFGVYEN